MSKIHLETGKIHAQTKLWSWSQTDTDGLQFLGVCSLKKALTVKFL